MEAGAVRRGAARDADRRRRRQTPSSGRGLRRRCWSAAARPGSTRCWRRSCAKRDGLRAFIDDGLAGDTGPQSPLLRRSSASRPARRAERSPAPSGRCRAFRRGYFAALRRAMPTSVDARTRAQQHPAACRARLSPRRIRCGGLQLLATGFLKADGEPYEPSSRSRRRCSTACPTCRSATPRLPRAIIDGDATGWRCSACWRARAPR